MNQFSTNPYDVSGQDASGQGIRFSATDEPVVRTSTKFIFIAFILFGIAGIIGGLMGIAQILVFSLSAASAKGNARSEVQQIPSAALAMHREVSPLPGLGLVANRSQFSDDLFAKDDSQGGADDSPAPAGGAQPTPGHATPGHAEHKHIHAADADQEEMVRRMLAEPFPGAMALSILIATLSVFISMAMLLGGVLGLMRKTIGLNLVKWTAGILIPFKLVESIFSNIYTYMKRDDILEPMKIQMRNQPDGAEKLAQLEHLFEAFIFVAIGMAVIWSIVLICFYLYVFLHTSRPSVRAAFR